MERWEHLLNELRAELSLREQELDLLHEIDLRLLDPDQTAHDIFSFIVKGTQKLLRSNHTTILMRRSTFLEPTYSNLTSVVGQRVLIADSLTGLSLEEDRTVSVPDLTKKPVLRQVRAAPWLSRSPDAQPAGHADPHPRCGGRRPERREPERACFPAGA